MEQAQRTEIQALTEEEIETQNKDAFDYLKGLLGEEESKVVYDLPKIEIVKRGTGKVVEVSIEHPLKWRTGLESETYFISAEKGLEQVHLGGELHLVSGLEYFVNIDDSVGPEGTRSESFFLPEGHDSSVTAASLIVQAVKNYTQVPQV